MFTALSGLSLGPGLRPGIERVGHGAEEQGAPGQDVRPPKLKPHRK